MILSSRCTLLHRSLHGGQLVLSRTLRGFSSSSGKAVDFRSDTVTQPSHAVRLRASGAVVGDDVYGEDPTVNELEQHMSRLLGKEASVFVPSATMGNLVALAASNPRKGSAVLLGRTSHIMRWEQEGMSSLLSQPLRVMPHSADSQHPGELCLKAIRQELEVDDIHVAPVGAVAVENTHAESGGRALSFEYMESLGGVCTEFGTTLHVDGARLANAATVIGSLNQIPVDEALRRLVRPANTVSLCLSKGLGAPAGAIVAGDARMMHHARRARKLLGGGMRQSGILAGAALAAIEENMGRLNDDHILANTLATGLGSIDGVRMLKRPPDATNILLFELDLPSGIEEHFMTAMRTKHNVLIGYGYEPGWLRMVVHRDISPSDVDFALNAIKAELQNFLPSMHVDIPPVAAVNYDKKHLTLEWADGLSSRFMHVWLRDHCPQSMHPTSYQRLIDTLDIPTNTHPSHACLEDGALKVDWDAAVPLHNGHLVSTSYFPLKWLREHSYQMSKRLVPQQTFWSSKQPFTLPEVGHEEWMCTENGLRKGMEGLRKYGALIVRGTPTSPEGTQKAVERIGIPQSTFYGTMWDTAPKADGDVNDTAYTNLELKPHNDCTYLRNQPALQVFNCAEQSALGGHTWLVDGFSVAEALRDQHPEAFAFFSTVPIPCMSIDDHHGVHMRFEAPIINVSKDGAVTGFRLNNDDRAPLDALTENEVEQFYKHLPTLLQMSRAPAHGCQVMLSIGDMLIVENRRVMHGRRAFKGYRNLRGCYMDSDAYESRLRMLDIR